MKDVVKIFKALSNDGRLKIVKLLSHHPMCVNALAAHLEMSQPAVSQHLKVLENAGMVSKCKRGYWVHYTLEREKLRAFTSFIQDLIKEAKEDA